MQLTWAQALSWRLGRHGLHPVLEANAAEVVERLVALRAWPAELAELSVGARQSHPEPGTLARLLDQGALLRSYALRGGSYVLTHQAGAELLTVRASGGIWATARYQAQGGFAIDDWQPLRAAVREALAEGPLTRAELAEHLERIPALRHLAASAREGAGSDALVKPLHWWGDICFGPDRGGQSTFRLLAGDPRWPDALDGDEAGRRAVRRYLGSYGPARVANLEYWLAEGLGVPRRRLSGWIAELGGELTEVLVDGEPRLALSDDLEALAAAEPTDALRLLPGYDPWVMGPGTAEERIVPPAHRAEATRGANLVIRGGVVSGTWKPQAGTVEVTWFTAAAPTEQLERELQRLAALRSGPD